MTEQTSLDGANALYLDLLKKLLTATPYEQSAWRLLEPVPASGARRFRNWLRNAAIKTLRQRSLLLVKWQSFDALARSRGEDWPMIGFTMVGLKRLENIQSCLEDVLSNGVPGDFLECGVWRGGSSIFARGVLKAHGVTDRKVWLADSFEGMPKITSAQDSVDRDFSEETYLAVSLDQVKENFRKLDLLDDRVDFIKGWFADSLPNAPVDRLAVLRLDGDHYSSTMDALTNLYDKVSVGGYIIIDDYNAFVGCKNAVTEFLAARNIDARIKEIDRIGVYWRKDAM
jgi:O-methyltransferase